VADLWQRDSAQPVLGLGAPGAFDDTHIFAPCCARLYRRWHLYYCGARGAVSDRVFRLGLATSDDGVAFSRHATEPLFAMPDGRSVLTPCFLRNPDGDARWEDRRLTLYISAADLAGGDDTHTVHSVTSEDGLVWDTPSPALVPDAYAPTVLAMPDGYRMWYTDVAAAPWSIRTATSADGRQWHVHPEPVLEIDQEWETSRLFYPHVIYRRGCFLMWYGAYWAPGPHRTALGLATSVDGLTWSKCADNPVFRPEPANDWESHYTTSESLLQLPDGRWRLWYAARTAPPFVHKYFAIGSAVAPSLAASQAAPAGWHAPLPEPANTGDLVNWQAATRQRLRTAIGVPPECGHDTPAAEARGVIAHDDIVIEKWVIDSEPGSRLPAIVYRPAAAATAPRPTVVLTFGHGGSKSQPSYQYMAQVFAKLGCICIAADPIGEEERHRHGQMGTRAHDPKPVHCAAWDAGRPIMGKLVSDTMRCIDYALSRADVDPNRIGVVGNSLGGAKASWLTALEPRLRFAIISGWALGGITERYGKFCTRVPHELLRRYCSWTEFFVLSAPHCAVLLMNGDADVVIDKDGTGEAWADTDAALTAAAAVEAQFGLPPERLRSWYCPGGGHRPYPAHRDAVHWLCTRGILPEYRAAQVDALSDRNFGEWAGAHGITFEPLYAPPLHLAGATVVDLGIRPLARDALAVLTPDERGTPAFTIEGWLERVTDTARSAGA
jgi:dienelactone hydrolase